MAEENLIKSYNDDGDLFGVFAFYHIKKPKKIYMAISKSIGVDKSFFIGFLNSMIKVMLLSIKERFISEEGDFNDVESVTTCLVAELIKTAGNLMINKDYKFYPIIEDMIPKLEYMVSEGGSEEYKFVGFSKEGKYISNASNFEFLFLVRSIVYCNLLNEDFEETQIPDDFKTLSEREWGDYIAHNLAILIDTLYSAYRDYNEDNDDDWDRDCDEEDEWDEDYGCDG